MATGSEDDDEHETSKSFRVPYLYGSIYFPVVSASEPGMQSSLRAQLEDIKVIYLRV